MPEWKTFQDFIDAAVDRFGGKQGGQTRLAQAVNELLPASERVSPQAIQYLQERNPSKRKPARGSRITHLIARVAELEPPGGTAKPKTSAPANEDVGADGEGPPRPTLSASMAIDETALLQFFRDIRNPTSRARVLRFVISEWQARHSPLPGDPDVDRIIFRETEGDGVDVRSEGMPPERVAQLRGELREDDRGDRGRKGATDVGRLRAEATASRHRKLKQPGRKKS